MLCFEEEEAVEGDEIAFVSDEVKAVAPDLIEAHTHGGEMIGGGKLACPHLGERFRLEDAVAIELAKRPISVAELETPPAGPGLMTSKPMGGFSLSER